jgi:hypothetical protein
MIGNENYEISCGACGLLGVDRKKCNVAVVVKKTSKFLTPYTSSSVHLFRIARFFAFLFCF